MKREAKTTSEFRDHCLAKAQVAKTRAENCSDKVSVSAWNNVADIYRYIALQAREGLSRR